MKIKILVFFLLFYNSIFSQFTSEKIISNEADGAASIYTADLDGDGDVDVISASQNDNKIAWYKNDGTGKFSDQIIISEQALFAQNLYASDLDNDGDIDIISTSFSDMKIAWYENNGAGEFSTENILSTEADRPSSVFAADLDGDGDNDIVSTAEFDPEIVWYKNEGDGVFSSPIAISIRGSQNYATKDIYISDIDSDGDMDLLAASTLQNKVAWYANDGLGNFTERTVSEETQRPITVHAVDLDGDDDIDVLSGSSSAFDKLISWYENQGDGTFSSPKIITDKAFIPNTVFAADLDRDGDVDVLSSSALDNKIAWYRNEGDGIFSDQQIISSQADGATSVHAADLDGDGDVDVLSSSLDDKIAWYENTIQISTSTRDLVNEIHIFPNPFNEFITLRVMPKGDDILLLNLLDASGKKIQSFRSKNDNVFQLLTNHLPSGLYFYQVINRTGYPVSTGKLVKY